MIIILTLLGFCIVCVFISIIVSFIGLNIDKIMDKLHIKKHYNNGELCISEDDKEHIKDKMESAILLWCPFFSIIFSFVIAFIFPNKSFLAMFLLCAFFLSLFTISVMNGSRKEDIERYVQKKNKEYEEKIQQKIQEEKEAEYRRIEIEQERKKKLQQQEEELNKKLKEFEEEKRIEAQIEIEKQEKIRQEQEAIRKEKERIEELDNKALERRKKELQAQDEHGLKFAKTVKDMFVEDLKKLEEETKPKKKKTTSTKKSTQKKKPKSSTKKSPNKESDDNNKKE